MKRIIVLFVIASCCVEPVDEGAQAGIADDPSGCSQGQHVGWGDDERSVCIADAVWPPASAGSRNNVSSCVLADGVYDIAWHTDISESIRPTFSVTHKARVSQNRVELDTWPYSLAWTDAGLAYAWEPGSVDIREFRIASNCEGGIDGWMTLELPYVNPGRQVETWWLHGVRTP